MTEQITDLVIASYQAAEGQVTATNNDGKGDEVAASNHEPSPSV